MKSGLLGGSWRRFAWIALTSGAMWACSGEGTTGQAAQAVYGGVVDDGGNDAVVAVRVGTGNPFTLCTGALVAPNLVLTAWHCVAQSVASTIGCDAQGQSTGGDQLGADVAPSGVGVFLGVRPDVYGAADAKGTRIFHAGGAVMCNDDVAYVALDHALAPPPLALRLSPTAIAGESVSLVGYGQNDGGYGTAVRVRKTGLDVIGVGAGVSPSNTSLGSNEFELGESTCQGDSGGPALDASGAIVGIVSRGGACTNDFGHVFDEPAGEQDVMYAAFAYVSATPLEEPINGAGSDSGSGSGLTAGKGQGACSARIAPNAPPDTEVALLIGLALLALGRRRA